jgi:hypothetical protein
LLPALCALPSLKKIAAAQLPILLQRQLMGISRPGASGE